MRRKTAMLVRASYLDKEEKDGHVGEGGIHE
jgi:hypothetical protein